MKALLPALALILAMFITAGAAHAERVKVAIVPGIAVNLDAARVDALSQDLADALSTELEVDAVGGLEVRRQLPPEGLPPDCVATPACVADVAKRLDAAQLLFVVMVDSGGGGSVQIDSTWIEPATGKSASRPAIDIAVITDARSRFAAAARSLLPDAPVRPKPPTGGNGGGTMTTAVPRHFTKTSMVTAGVAVVGLGMGIGFGIRAKNLFNDCDKPSAPCSSSQEDKIRNTALIADVGFLVAAAGAVATAVLFATSGEESRMVVSPSVESSGGVSLILSGTFR
ncbi:MAG: hypothetical protein H0T89_35340 [Deltaproteobacteria bacterium]|nr:hypothetical protein [Deltaproteobacteria bacterium]MDQ3298551.1 hypothetical protein [Myxococcota bacterium]